MSEPRAAEAGGDTAYEKSSIAVALLELSRAHDAAARTQGTEGAAALAAAETGLLIVGEYVVIDVIADIGESESVLAELEALGLREGAAFGRVVSGLMPISEIEAIATIGGVTMASAGYALPAAGSIQSEGDPALGTDLVRDQFGVDGSGVTVAVFSDSYDNLGGEAADIASGDLPPDGVRVFDDLPFGGTDEGRAMAQLIHDVAPGATLWFDSAFLGQANFAQSIVDIADAGADIIVDDFIYFAEPFFADGVIAQAIDAVVADGVTYFSAAGNNARNSYEAAFRPVAVSPQAVSTDPSFIIGAGSGSTFHDFDPGPGVDLTQNYRLGVGEDLTLSFQWDQPYASTGAASPGSASDYDIWLINARTGAVLDASVTDNIGGDPIEVLSYTNDTGLHLDVALVIVKHGDEGPDAGLIKFINFGEAELAAGEDRGENDAPTSYGHPIAEGAIGVGASAWFLTPPFGVDPPEINDFSSAGGIPILFDADGERLDEPVIRDQPSIVGPDGASTTFFLFEFDFDGDGVANFYGTSAASPHVAAAAALMLAIDPDLTPEEIREILQDTAIDMDDPFTPGFDEGFDLGTGHGFVDALAAVYALDNLIVGSDLADSLDGRGGDDALYGLDGTDRLFGGEGDDRLDGGAGADVLRGGADDDALVDLAGDDLLDGGSGSDFLSGGDGDDFLIGRSGRDWLEGGDGRDSLRGQDDADILIGGAGRDILIGAAAGDAYVYLVASDSTPDPAMRDTILGFRGAAGDRIDLSAIDAVAGTETNDVFTVAESFSGTAGELVFFQSQNGDIWRVRGDVDGDGAADLEILVEAPLGLSESDFAL